jgi:predicted GIY-YIG superfamily endonuclease
MSIASVECIYTIPLKKGHYYVGRTENLKRRIESHASGEGCEWTKKYPPLKTKKEQVEPLNGSFGQEDQKVKEMMVTHGIDKVRGGSYSSVKLTPGQQWFLQKEFRTHANTCLSCGSSTHYIDACPDQYPAKKRRKLNRSTKPWKSKTTNAKIKSKKQ